jgi:Na+-driven multidrug efflux pump
MMHLIRLSASGTFQVLVGTASYVALIRILSTFGSNAVAGYTIAIRLVVFWILPSWGLSNAAATLVGQSLGARDPERAERAVWIAAGYDMAVMAVVSVVFILFTHPIVALFTHSPEAGAIGAQALRIMSYGFIFYALGMVVTQSFNGAGDTWTPTWINLFCFWFWEIPLAYFLSRVLNLGPQGVFISILLGYSSLALVSMAVFRRGRWKQRIV